MIAQLLAFSMATAVLHLAQGGDEPPALTLSAGLELVAAAPAQEIAAYLLTVLVPSLPDSGARAMVIRRPEGTGTLNVIMVTEETTSRDLLRALAALNQSRRRLGEKVPQGEEQRALIMPAKGAGAESGNGPPDVEAFLARLRATPPAVLPGIGRYPSVTTSLPALR
ncbi:MAG: hypothetical protein AB1941_24240 [Gemmatimonadota bacterium]